MTKVGASGASGIASAKSPATRAVDLSEAFTRALSNLAVHKLRSALTMLGMIFGVGAVIAMLSIGAGAEKQAQETIARLGISNLLVRAKELKGDELQEARKRSPGVSARDMEAIAEAVPGVEFTAPRVRINPWRVKSETAAAEGATADGVSHRHAELTGLTLSEGRFLTADDEKRPAQVCVLGAATRRDLFGANEALGHDVKVNDLWLTVVGILTPQSDGGESFQGVAVGGTAKSIYLPWTTALRKLDRDPMESPFAEAIVRLKPGVSPAETGELLPPLLDRLHGGAADFEVVVPEKLLRESQRTQRLFRFVMGGIAGISLLVGGIGIMNIMLATVLERTREIGVRRAIGATRKDIRFQFVVEAFALSSVGGIVGVLIGVLISRLVALSAGWPTVVTLFSLVLSTGVSAAVGLGSGLYPAVRAAALDPIEALRYE